MPTVYENPAAHRLVLVGELQELHIYEDVFCYDWRIAVWQDSDWKYLWYAVESKSGERFAAPPFEHVDSRSKLHLLETSADFDRFKHELNDYWWSKRIPAHHLRSDERWMRNKRSRLQRKVGRIIFAN